MPSGQMPTYSYRPAASGNNPTIKTRSARRARSFAGGTYFRAREPGIDGNNISVELIEWIDEDNKPQGRLIVTNYNVKFDENVIGPVNVDLLTHKLKWNEEYKIKTITSSTARAINSISVQIARRWEEQETDMGVFEFSRLFHIPNQLSVKLTPKVPEFTPGVTIIIKPRTRVYELSQITKAQTPIFGQASESESGWDPDALREAVNASDPWIEMRPRGEDVQDDVAADDNFLLPFSETYLRGGDGLPAFPSGERSGPTRSLIHINYSERYDGSMGEVNVVYEWAGESNVNGRWTRY